MNRLLFPAPELALACCTATRPGPDDAIRNARGESLIDRPAVAP